MSLRDTRRRVDATVETWAERWAWYRKYWAPITGGLGTTAYVAANWPLYATGAAGAALLLAGVTQKDEPDAIQRLRPAVAEIIGTNTKMRLTGEHPAGGPQQFTIDPPDGWRYWKTETWRSLERAVEFVLTGDWEKVKESTDGIVWERLPELPPLVPYTEHFDLPWWQIPVGDDGLGNVRCMNLNSEEGGYAHWLLSGDNGSGKTTGIGVAGIHLLAHRDELAGIVLLDVKGFGLKRFADREGVIYQAIGDFDAIQEGFAWLRDEYEARKRDLNQHNRFRKPIVVLWDEIEETISDANQIGEKIRGVEYPTLVMNALTVGRMARELGIHIIGGTQRPDGTSIPTKLRAQLRGRVVYGAMDQKGAEMAVGAADAPRITNMKGPVGINVVKGADWIGYTQGLWLANWLNKNHRKADRDVAASLLPPKATIPPRGTGTRTSPETDEGVRIEDLDKPRIDSAGTSASTNGGAGTGTGTVETPHERYLRLNREATQRWRENVRTDLRNPDSKYHGTKTGCDLGCPCDRCRAVAKVKVS